MSDDPRTDGPQTEGPHTGDTHAHDTHAHDTQDLRPDDRRTGGGGSERQRRLTRRSQDRVLGGVASGLADYFGVDPLVARLVFAGLALYGGLGVLAYALCWLVIPADDASAENASGGRTAARVTGVVLIVVAGLSILPNLTGSPFGWWGPGPAGPAQPGLVFGLLVIALGYALYRYGEKERDPGPRDPGTAHDAARASAASPSQTPPPGAAPASPAGGPVAPRAAPSAGAPGPGDTTVGPAGAPGPAGTPAGPSGAQAAPSATAEPEPPARARSPLGRLTLALALLVVGLAALLERADVLALGIPRLLALGLLVVGSGLIVGAWWGRARWLIAVGSVLTPVVLAAALVAAATPWDGPRLVDIGPGSGDLSYQPTSVAELPEAYELASGRIVVDLRELEVPDNEIVEVRANVAAGQIDVRLPPEVDAEITGRALVGAVRVPGQRRGGVLVEADGSSTGSGGADAGTVRLDLSVLTGEVVVHEPPSGALDQGSSDSQGER